MRLTESDQRLQVAKGTIDSHSQKQVAAQVSYDDAPAVYQYVVYMFMCACTSYTLALFEARIYS